MANSLKVNLKGYWKFDESSGNAADATGNGNTLTNNGTIAYASTGGIINNYATLVKATPSWFSLANASQTGLSITGNLSVNFWVYLTTVPGAGEEYPIFWKYATANQKSYGFRIRNSGPDIQFICTSDGSTDTAGTVSWSPASVTWYMVTVVYTAAGGTVDFYVNTTQQGTQQSGLATSIFSGTSNFLVGDRLDAGDTTVNLGGRLDEMGIWAKALTATDMTNLYNGGAGYAYSNFDSGGSTVVHNLGTLGAGA